MSLLLFPLSRSCPGCTFATGCCVLRSPSFIKCSISLSLTLPPTAGQGSKWSSAFCRASPLGWPLWNLWSTHCRWWPWASPAQRCSSLSLKGWWGFRCQCTVQVYLWVSGCPHRDFSLSVRQVSDRKIMCPLKNINNKLGNQWWSSLTVMN